MEDITGLAATEAQRGREGFEQTCPGISAQLRRLEGE